MSRDFHVGTEVSILSVSLFVQGLGAYLSSWHRLYPFQ